MRWRKKVGLNCRVQEEENVGWDECIWISRTEQDLIHIIHTIF